MGLQSLLFLALAISALARDFIVTDSTPAKPKSNPPKEGPSELLKFLWAENWESGYISVVRPEDQLFYLLLKNKNASLTNPPLILWFNGGPGCSSLLGLFQEIGPFLIDKRNYTFKPNQYSWNNLGDVLFVDQPVHVGFSISQDNDTLCKNETCVALNFYAFLRKFYEKYPEYKGRDMYLTGESYAGRYLPAIGAYIHKTNANADIKMKGIAIGNPSTERLIQIASLPAYLLEMGNITTSTYLLFRPTAWLCQEAIVLNSSNVLELCSINKINLTHIPNPYDIRERKSYDDMDKALEDELNRAVIQKMLGAKKNKYESCNYTVNEWFGLDWVGTQRPDVEYLLAKKVPLMYYFGDMDAQVNWRGGERLCDSFVWDYQSQYVATPYKDWKIDDHIYGRYRTTGEFTFLRFHDAGHMVPMDQPMAALEMMKKFMAREFK